MSFNGHWWFIALSSIFENVFLLLKVPTIGRMLSIRFDLLTKHILWRVFSVCFKDVLIFKNVFRCNILLHLYAMYTNLIAVASFKVIDRIYLFNLKHIDSTLYIFTNLTDMTPFRLHTCRHFHMERFHSRHGWFHSLSPGILWDMCSCTLPTFADTPRYSSTVRGCRNRQLCYKSVLFKCNYKHCFTTKHGSFQSKALFIEWHSNLWRIPDNYRRSY